MVRDKGFYFTLKRATVFVAAVRLFYAIQLSSLTSLRGIGKSIYSPPCPNLDLLKDWISRSTSHNALKPCVSWCDQSRTVCGQTRTVSDQSRTAHILRSRSVAEAEQNVRSRPSGWVWFAV